MTLLFSLFSGLLPRVASLFLFFLANCNLPPEINWMPKINRTKLKEDPLQAAPPANPLLLTQEMGKLAANSMKSVIRFN